MRFDLIDLQLFAEVAEAGSITRSAERLHFALASASARIAHLEDALGAPLLLRQRRGVQLTPAGRALLHHARIVLGQVDQMRADLSDYAHGLKAHIRLLSNTAALTEHLPEALHAFLAQHPTIDLGIEELPSYDIVTALAARRADIGIVADTVDMGELQAFPFRRDDLVVVLAAHDPLTRNDRIRFAEVLQHPFIGLNDGSALEQHIAEHAARLGARPSYRVRLRSFDAICRMVEAGIGVGIIPQTAAQRCRRSMAIEHRPLDEPWAARQLSICVRDHDQLPTHTQALMNHLLGHDATTSP
ncbi:LysR family transcriptional regulator [Sciscionella marina]|uniref:LysR family transcriptional regulator n=1 Tax=Sciscionella marina TaxID=508770 RepID=UPI00036829B6|nr:LysR family transcriptional regulator [Sciscionella marina]